MKRMKGFEAIFFSFLLLSFSSWGQDAATIRKNIRTTSTLLESYRRSDKSSVYELKLLNKKIQEQKRYVNLLERDLGALNTSIKNIRDSIAETERYYNELHQEYSDMVRFAYLNRDTYKTYLFLFSATSFNQAYKRFLYLRNYASRRKRYFGLLQDTQELLHQQQILLNKRLEEKQKLHDKRRSMLARLQTEFSKKEKLLLRLRSEETKIQAKLKEYVRLAQEMNAEISRDILESLKPLQHEDYKDSGNLTTATNSFRGQKGKLPWPLANAVVINEFGEHPHPFLNNVMVSNAGIDISTSAHAKVYSVYSGVVAKIVKIPGLNYSVLVRHGLYYSLYANLEAVDVKSGEEILTGDKIGTVDVDFQDENLYLLRFQLWQQSKHLNPLEWLSKK